MADVKNNIDENETVRNEPLAFSSLKEMREYLKKLDLNPTVGKRSRICYDRNALLEFRSSATIGIPNMKSFPLEIIKVNDQKPLRAPPPVTITLGRSERIPRSKNAWTPSSFRKSRNNGGGESNVKEAIKNEIVKKTRGILNKLTPDNFDKLVLAFLELQFEDQDERIGAVVNVLFEKAVDEPKFAPSYAKMVRAVCDTSQLTAKKFRRQILEQCQKEFEKEISAEEEFKILQKNILTAPEETKGQLKLELLDKKNSSRRRNFGNIHFVGELYKLQMLSPKIMVDCIQALLANDDEESYECLCKLLCVIGQRLDNHLHELEIRDSTSTQQLPTFHPPERFMDKTFFILSQLREDKKFSSRVRFAMLDLIELRESDWKPRRTIEVPKEINEIHRDADREKEEEMLQNQLLRDSEQPRRIQQRSGFVFSSASNSSSRFRSIGRKSASEVDLNKDRIVLAPNCGDSIRKQDQGV